MTVGANIAVADPESRLLAFDWCIYIGPRAAQKVKVKVIHISTQISRTVADMISIT